MVQLTNACSAYLALPRQFKDGKMVMLPKPRCEGHVDQYRGLTLNTRFSKLVARLALRQCNTALYG
eukprot:12766368-Prorocentrum_lima.AAC.1